MNLTTNHRRFIMKSNLFLQLAASFAFALALTLTLTISLVACGSDIPDGKYVKKGSHAYWEFSGDKATYYLNDGHPAQKGTYKIDLDGMFIFTKEDGTIDKKWFGLEGKSLLLGDAKYTKQ